LPGVPASVACTTIRTPLDLRIFPASSARIGGAADIVIRSTTHQGLLRSRAVFESIRTALLAPRSGGDTVVGSGGDTIVGSDGDRVAGSADAP
jgi:hypothetical protein